MVRGWSFAVGDVVLENVRHDVIPFCPRLARVFVSAIRFWVEVVERKRANKDVQRVIHPRPPLRFGHNEV